MKLGRVMFGSPKSGYLTTVKALVRWATGKRLINRLPKLSLIKLGLWSSYGAVRA